VLNGSLIPAGETAKEQSRASTSALPPQPEPLPPRSHPSELGSILQRPLPAQTQQEMERGGPWLSFAEHPG